MNLLDRLHTFAARLGFSPKVFDPLALAILGVVVNAILGNPLDLEAVKTAGVLVLYAIVGGVAPPALGENQQELNHRAKIEARRRER